MFYRHSADKLIFPVIGLILVMTVSYRPTHHLRTEMPAAFFSAASDLKRTEKVATEKKIAWAYWESAQMDVQWKYGYRHSLPVDPPREFRVDARALGPDASDPTVRLLYWHRLQ